MWRKVKPVIIKKLFIPFIIYLVLFEAYTVLAFTYEDNKDWNSIRVILGISTLVFLIYFLIIEIIQFRSVGSALLYI